MNQSGPNATANIGTYNDVKESQTNYKTIYEGSSQDQEDISAIVHLKIAESPGENKHQTCTANTRVQIQQDIHEWAEDGTTTKQIFWLADRAGTGKSAVAKQIAEDWKSEGKAVVSFVFSITAADTRTNGKFCQTIAAKLADLRNFGSFRSTLAEALRQNLTLETLNFSGKFEKLLRAPLKKTNKPVLVVIDALDECDKKDRSELLSVLLSKLNELPMVKILITSRPEPDIVEKLEHQELVHSSNLQGSGDIDSTTEDIRQYLSIMFANSTKLHSFQSYVSKLAKASDGMFIYASTAYKYLESSLNLNLALSTIESLSGLDGLYSLVMEHAIPDNDAISRQAVHSVLQAFIAAQRPLSVSEMQTLLNNDRVVQSVVEVLASVLSTGAEDTPVEILHPTFREYLTDRSGSGVYFVDVTKGHQSLATGCLEICSAKSTAFPKEDSDTISPILEYAVLSWPVHADVSIRATNTQDVQSLESQITCFFKKDLIHWIEWVVLLEAVYPSIQNLATLEASTPLASVSATGPTVRTFERKCWCRDSHRFLQHHQLVIEQGYKHTRGAVAFTPKESLIYRVYFARFARRIPAVLCGIPTEWPSYQTLSGHTSHVNNVVFSPDGAHIVSGSWDNTLRLWDGTTGASIGGPINGHTGVINSVAFSPDGTRVVSASDDKTLRLWDGATGASIGQPISGHTRGVSSVAFSPDGAHIVSGSWDHTLQLWDGMTGASVGQPMSGHTNGVSRVAFSSDGARIISSSSDCSLRLWDGVTGASVGRPMRGHTDWIMSVAFSPDGTRAVSSSRDQTLRLWDGTTGAGIGGPINGHTSLISCVAFSLDGTRVVSGSWDHTLRLWDGMTGTSIGGPINGHTREISCVAFFPDGARIVSASNDNTLRMWDSMTGASIGGPINGHTCKVICVALSPDGARIVSGSEDYTLRLSDSITGTSIGRPISEHTDRITCVAFSLNETRVISGSDDCTLQLWDAMTGTRIGMPLKGHTGSIRSVAFSPDGTYVVSVSDDETFQFWDGVTGASLGRLVQQDIRSVSDMAFSPDGTHIFTTFRYGSIRLWRVSSYTQLGVFGPSLDQVADIYSHSANRQVEFSTCGSYILSDGDLWDIRSLPPSFVNGRTTGTMPIVSTQSPSPVHYNKESRTIEVHTSSVLTFPVSGCQVSSWKAQGGRITLGMEDRRVVIIDCTHLL